MFHQVKHHKLCFKRTSGFLGFAEGIHFDTVVCWRWWYYDGLTVFVNPVRLSDAAEGQFERGLGDAVIVDGGDPVHGVNHGHNPFPIFCRDKV